MYFDDVTKKFVSLSSYLKGQSVYPAFTLVFSFTYRCVINSFCCFRGCFLTSTLIATVAVSLTIPLSMLADVLFEQVHYPILLYIGSLPMFIAFFAVTLLAQYDNCDPVLDVARHLYYCLCKRNRSIR